MNAPTSPAPRVAKPFSLVPAGACDAHTHVFGPFTQFPTSHPSVYPLPGADAAVHRGALERMGMARGVLVQPAPYGDDPSALLNAIALAKGDLRGVAVAGPGIAQDTLASWRVGGILGLRFVEMRAPSGDRYPGSIGFDALHDMAPRLRELGMHAELWASAEQLATHLPRLTHLGVLLVVEHMGMPDLAAGVSDGTFANFLRCVADPNVWVKLSLCRASKQPPLYEDARDFHAALIAAAPERMLWGSDWPYVRLEPAPEAGRMLDLFMTWVGDAALSRRILVENPERLYEFTPTRGEE